MNQINRAIIIVLDSVGMGEMPDAAEYGDVGSNTLAHVAEAVGGLHVPNMQRLGLGNIVPISGVEPADAPEGHYGKMATISKGKDTTVGHWEMMGVITDPAFPTYPHGFPAEVIAKFEKRVGRNALGNKAASGTEIIKELGEEHMRTGSLIVYTSADSVFQIAAHEEIIPIDELYRICEMAREMLVAPHNVERVIARPFIGEPGTFSRTERRRDFSLKPTDTSLLDLVKQSGREVIGIGQIEDIFAGCGISRSIHTGNNPDGIEATISAISSGQGSIIFTNLADFDMLYGHRNDPQGYARALEDFDAALPRIIDALHDDDLLIITADHGCDPTTPSTDHCREYVPILVYGKNILKSIDFAGGSEIPSEHLATGGSEIPPEQGGIDLGTRTSLCDLAVTLAEVLGVAHSFKGTSF